MKRQSLNELYGYQISLGKLREMMVLMFYIMMDRGKKKLLGL